MTARPPERRFGIAVIRIGLNLLFVIGGAGLLLAVPFVLMGFLDRRLGLREALEGAGVGVLLVGFFLFTLTLRTWWYRTRGIFVSWRCFVEALHATIGRPPLTREDIATLVQYSNERQAPDARLANLYQVAFSRRHESEDAEEEFRGIADLLFRYLSNVHQVSQHTILTEYRPEQYRTGAVFGWLWAACGLGAIIAGLVLGGIAAPGRVMLVAGGIWGVSVGVGLARRWRWALPQGVLFLILVEAASFYFATSPESDHLAALILPGFYVPLFMGIYLYRRRAWFWRTPHKRG